MTVKMRLGIFSKASAMAQSLMRAEDRYRVLGMTLDYGRLDPSQNGVDGGRISIGVQG